VQAIPVPAGHGQHLWTGIRAVDLLAPVRRGSLQWWPAAYRLGQYVMAGVLSAALAPVQTWYVGFDQVHVDSHSIRHGMEECALLVQIHLAPRNLDPSGRRRYFAGAVHRLRQSPAGRLVVFCLADAGHTHDVEVILPSLAADPRVLTTVVIEPFTGEYRPAGAEPPEGFHGQVVFDPRRAARRLYPAIDPLTTVARSYPDERHRQLADKARSLLAAYARFDPELVLAGPEGTDRAELEAAQALIRYLAQPVPLAEPFTSEPAELTPYPQLLDEVEDIVRNPAGSLAGH
jgi:hypothetical protein